MKPALLELGQVSDKGGGRAPREAGQPLHRLDELLIRETGGDCERHGALHLELLSSRRFVSGDH
jgi:hypothetical protein